MSHEASLALPRGGERLRLPRAGKGARGLALPLALGGAALVAGGLSLVLFASGSRPGLDWLLYLVALILCLLAFWRLDGPRPRLALRRPSAHGSRSSGSSPSRFAFRAYRIDSLPAGSGGTRPSAGSASSRSSRDPSYRPVFVGGRAQGATALWYTMAPFVAALGPTALALRATVVLAGTLGVARDLPARARAVRPARRAGRRRDRRRPHLARELQPDRVQRHLVGHARRARRLPADPRAQDAPTLRLRARRPDARPRREHVLHDPAAADRPRRLPAAPARARARRASSGGCSPASPSSPPWRCSPSAPLVQFGDRQPRRSSRRGSPRRACSGRSQSTGGIAPVVSNLREHVLMFNYAGDDNGRHNLPGAPMLDQVVGAAFVLGLALCLRGDPPARGSRFCLPGCRSMLAGGVFSLSFEAPQALRTIDETTAVALLAALPIVGLWGAIRGAADRARPARACGLARPTLAAMPRGRHPRRRRRSRLPALLRPAGGRLRRLGRLLDRGDHHGGAGQRAAAGLPGLRRRDDARQPDPPVPDSPADRAPTLRGVGVAAHPRPVGRRRLPEAGARRARSRRSSGSTRGPRSRRSETRSTVRQPCSA